MDDIHHGHDKNKCHNYHFDDNLEVVTISVTNVM
jgi:hypothetical protein